MTKQINITNLRELADKLSDLLEWRDERLAIMIEGGTLPYIAEAYVDKYVIDVLHATDFFIIR